MELLRVFEFLQTQLNIDTFIITKVELKNHGFGQSIQNSEKIKLRGMNHNKMVWSVG